eukprot:2555152-Rhodomonas_salina.1
MLRVSQYCPTDYSTTLPISSGTSLPTSALPGSRLPRSRARASAVSSWPGPARRPGPGQWRGCL